MFSHVILECGIWMQSNHLTKCFFTFSRLSSITIDHDIIIKFWKRMSKCMFFLPSPCHSAFIQILLKRMSTTSYGRSMLRWCYACNIEMKQCLMNYFLMHAPSSSPQFHPTMMSPSSTLTKYEVLVNHVLNHKFFHHVLRVCMHSILLIKILLVLFWPSELALCIATNFVKLFCKSFSSIKFCHPSFVIVPGNLVITFFRINHSTLSTYITLELCRMLTSYNWNNSCQKCNNNNFFLVFGVC